MTRSSDSLSKNSFIHVNPTNTHSDSLYKAPLFVEITLVVEPFSTDIPPYLSDYTEVSEGEESTILTRNQIVLSPATSHRSTSLYRREV